MVAVEFPVEQANLLFNSQITLRHGFVSDKNILRGYHRYCQNIFKTGKGMFQPDPLTKSSYCHSIQTHFLGSRDTINIGSPPFTLSPTGQSL